MSGMLNVTVRVNICVHEAFKLATENAVQVPVREQGRGSASTGGRNRRASERDPRWPGASRCAGAAGDVVLDAAGESGHALRRIEAMESSKAAPLLRRFICKQRWRIAKATAAAHLIAKRSPKRNLG